MKVLLGTAQRRAPLPTAAEDRGDRVGAEPSAREREHGDVDRLGDPKRLAQRRRRGGGREPPQDGGRIAKHARG